MHATVTADWARDFGDVLTPMDDGGDAFPVFPRPYLAVDLDLGPNELDRKVAALVPAGGECRWPKAWRRRHVHGGIPGVRDSRSIAGGGGSDLSWSAEVLLDRLERRRAESRSLGVGCTIEAGAGESVGPRVVAAVVGDLRRDAQDGGRAGIGGERRVLGQLLGQLLGPAPHLDEVPLGDRVPQRGDHRGGLVESSAPPRQLPRGPQVGS